MLAAFANVKHFSCFEFSGQTGDSSATTIVTGISNNPQPTDSFMIG
jgi:hypothetical protein